MITMLGWPQGGTASRRIDRVGRAAATAPPLEAMDPGWSRMGEITAPPDRPAAEVWPPA